MRTKLCSFLSRTKVTKRELLSLIGSLSFACRVVVPGRTFLSRLISLSCSVRKLDFKIYLTRQVKEDLRIWLQFLQHWNGRNFFLERTFTSSIDLDFSTDAASGCGYGGFLSGAWFAETWMGKQKQWSMPCQELFPILVAVSLWGYQWCEKRILVYCDNLPTVELLNKGYTSKEPAATMLRLITVEAMSHNFLLKASHIPGKFNVFSDLLSRQRIAEFLRLCTNAEQNPSVVPDHLKMFGSS